MNRLKELCIHALKREVGVDVGTESEDYETNEMGLPILTRRKKTVTNDLVRRLQEHDCRPLLDFINIKKRR